MSSEDWRPKHTTIEDPIATDIWSYRTRDGSQRTSRVTIGRPMPLPDGKDWYCPIEFEHVTRGIECSFGVGPVDALMNAMHFVRRRFYAFHDVTPRARPFGRTHDPKKTGSLKRPTARRSTSRPVKTRSTSGDDIDAYLARVAEPARTTLEKLRRTIRAAAPKATETLSYQIPTFRHLGGLVGFGATQKHCALYLMSGTVLEVFQEELSAYDTSKGTLRFPVDKPLPASLVRKLVKARLAENEARALHEAEAAEAHPQRSRSRRKQPARVKAVKPLKGSDR